MAWHTVALDLPPSTTKHMKHSVPDFGTLKYFHILLEYESSRFFHCRVIMKAFDEQFRITDSRLKVALGHGILIVQKIAVVLNTLLDLIIQKLNQIYMQSQLLLDHHLVKPLQFLSAHLTP